MLRANSEKLWKPGNLHRFITGGSVGGAPSSDLPSAGSEERGGGGGGDELVRGTCHPAALHDGGSGSGSVVVLPSLSKEEPAGLHNTSQLVPSERTHDGGKRNNTPSGSFGFQPHLNRAQLLLT